MALLLKWLHPDVDHSASHASLAKRVTMAWDNLKTAERRAAYDAERRPSAKGRASRRPGTRWAATRHGEPMPRPQSAGILRRGLSLLLGRPWR